MFVKMAGNYTSSLFALQESPITQQWICYGISQQPTSSSQPVDMERETAALPVPKLGAGQLCDEMFNTEDFDFSHYTRMTDEPTSPLFEPIDIDASLRTAIDSIQKSAPAVTSSVPVCFFSPNRIHKNSNFIQQKLQNVLEKQTSSARKNLFKYVFINLHPDHH